MSSPVRTPTTPTVRNGTSQRSSQRTPSRSRRAATNGTETDTPMRMGGRTQPGIVVENSDSVNVPTSPAAQNIPATSPAANNISEIDLSSPLNYGTPSSMGSIRTPRSGIRGTPVRARPDIRTDRRMRQVNIGSDAVSQLQIAILSFF